MEMKREPFKWQTRTDMNYLSMRRDILNHLLISRGVQDPYKLLNCNFDNQYSASLFNNIDKAIDLINDILENKLKVKIIVDSDADGYTSASLTYLLLKYLDLPTENMSYIIHNGKEHGIMLSEFTDYDFDVLIVPDAGTNDVEQMKLLQEKGKKILILDHHEFELDNPYGIIVNCQDGKYPNNTLSGVGVVYKVFEYYIHQYGKKLKDNKTIENFLPLVSLGMIGDSMSMCENLETRYLSLEGIERMADKDSLDLEFGLLLLYMMKSNEFNLKQGKENEVHINIMGISWYITPLINGTVRMGTMEQKQMLFECMIGLNHNQTVPFQPRRKKKTDPKPDKIDMPMIEYVGSKMLRSVKGKQDRAKNKALKILEERIVERNLLNNKFLIVNGTKDLDATFSGLVANKLADKYKRPVMILMLRDDKDKLQSDDLTLLYGGSCRNYGLFKVFDLKQFLKDNCEEQFKFLAGHPNAFGFGIERGKIVEMSNKVEKILEDVKIEDIYTVDFRMSLANLKNAHIKEVGELADTWGNGLEVPTFALTDITIPAKEIVFHKGERKNILKFSRNNIDFIMFDVKEDDYLNNIIHKTKDNRLGSGKSLQANNIKLDVIGEFQINHYEEKKNPQVKILDIYSVPLTKERSELNF